MSRWEEYKIGDLLILEYGKALKDYKDSLGKFDVYGTNGKIGFSDKFLYDKPALIIGRKGAYREVHLSSKPFFVIDTAFYTRRKNDLTDTLFMYYWFKNIDINLMDSGSAIPSTSREEVYDLQISLPPLPEQTAIAEVLSSLDDKIDLLHRQNKTLEQLAETLFRQWFVEEAEEGEVGTIESVCEQISSGGTPPTRIDAYYSGEINWYSTKELNDNYLFESKSKITREGLENSSAKVFPPNTVVIAIYAAPTVGRLGILANEAAFNQAACGFIVNEGKICYEYLYLHLLTSRQRLNDMASGSAQQNLNVRIMKEYEILIPSKEIHEKFRDQVRPMFNKIKSNTQQIRTLTQLRDTLLPKLMSGEVRVGAIWKDDFRHATPRKNEASIR